MHAPRGTSCQAWRVTAVAPVGIAARSMGHGPCQADAPDKSLPCLAQCGLPTRGDFGPYSVKYTDPSKTESGDGSRRALDSLGTPILALAPRLLHLAIILAMLQAVAD